MTSNNKGSGPEKSAVVSSEKEIKPQTDKFLEHINARGQKKMKPKPYQKDSGTSLPNKKDVKAGLEDLQNISESRSALSDNLINCHSS